MEYSKTKVKEIGYLQRKILLLFSICILTSFIFGVFLQLPQAVCGIVFPIFVIMCIIWLWKMLSLMGEGTVVKIISCALVLVPLLNLFTLLIFSNQACGILKLYGIKVGLLGASPEDLERLTSEELENVSD